MRRTGYIFFLFLSSFFNVQVCLADLQLKVPTSIDLNVPMPVSWTRTTSDPFQFLLQTIKFPSVLSVQQELISVDGTNQTLSGTMSITSRFSGPHIVVAMDPNTNRLVATSNSFVVGGSASTDTANQHPDNSSNVPAGAIVGAVIGGLASLILGVIALWYFLRRLRKKYGITNLKPMPLVDDSENSYRAASNSRVDNWRGYRIPSQPSAPTMAGTARTMTQRDSLSSAGRHPLSLTDVEVNTADHPYETTTTSGGLISMIAALRTELVNSERRTKKNSETQRFRVRNDASIADTDQYESSTAPPPSYVSRQSMVTAVASTESPPPLPTPLRAARRKS